MEVLAMSNAWGEGICQSCWSMPCKCSSVPFAPYPYPTYVTNSYWCQFCGAFDHTEVEKCPRVKKITYFANGSIRSVEFNLVPRSK